MNIIEDGTGAGNKLRVGADNRLQSRSVIETETIHNAESGKSYNFNTGLISVSGDATLIYFKNNDPENFIVTDIALAAGDGITHSDAPYVSVIRNPTAGDLITDATAVDFNANRNFGSSALALCDVYKGKDSGTVTGGTTLGIFQTNKAGRSFFSINLLLPRAQSVAIKLTANASSGSANYYCAIIGYYKDNLDI